MVGDTTVLVGKYIPPASTDPLCVHCRGGARAHATSGGEGTTRWARGGVRPAASGASAY
jgi:hypothetical protein